MSAFRPFGDRLTVEEAATIAGKSVRTVQRWIKGKHVRVELTEDGFRASRADVESMIGKRWTRTPRLRHTV